MFDFLLYVKNYTHLVQKNKKQNNNSIVWWVWSKIFHLVNKLGETELRLTLYSEIIEY